MTRLTFPKKFIYTTLLIVMTAIFIIGFSYLTFSNHDGLKTQMNDLGNMEQPIYNTLNGKFMRTSNYVISGVPLHVSRFGIHANLLLLLFVPIYRFIADPKILLFTQVFVVGMGAIPLYLLSRNYFKKDTFLNLIVPFTYLINPTLHDAVLYDFHPIVLTASLWMFAFYFLNVKKYIWFWIVFFLAIICKEDASLTGLALGIYMYFVQKDRQRGAAVFFICLIYFLFVVFILIPNLSSGTGFYLASKRYPFFTKEGIDNMANLAIGSPIQMLGTFLNMNKILYLFMLLFPVAYLPFFSLKIFLIATPSILVNILSRNPAQYSPFYYYYGASSLAFIFLASVNALYNLSKTRFRFSMSIAIPFLIIFSSLYSLYFSPAPYSLTSSVSDYKVDEHAKNIKLIQKVIPKTAALSVQNNLGAHFSQRERVYTYPYGVEFSEYILLDITNSYKNPRLFPRPWIFENVMGGGGISIITFNEKIQGLFDSEEFGVFYYTNDGYLIFKRGHPKDDNPKAYEIYSSRINRLIDDSLWNY